MTEDVRVETAQPLIDDAFCPSCGERRVLDKAFCANCGRAFEGTPAVQRPSQRLSSVEGSDVAIFGGAALLIAAPFFPFLTATAALVGSISRSGVEITNGEGLVLAAVGVIAGFIGFRNLGKPKGAAPVVVAVLGFALTIYYYIQIDGRIHDIGTDFAVASIGAGIWMAFAGSVLVAVATLVSNRRTAQ